MEGIHRDYNCKKVIYSRDPSKFKVEDILQAKLKQIMSGWKVSVTSPSATRRKMFEDLAHILGGTIVEQAEAHADYD